MPDLEDAKGESKAEAGDDVAAAVPEAKSETSAPATKASTKIEEVS